MGQTAPNSISTRIRLSGAPSSHRMIGIVASVFCVRFEGSILERRGQFRAPRMRRQYKIQEVIKRRQILLVQVVKEERGNKGAALTTYLSLAGRYCVLMPNAGRGGGISRKISNPNDRKRMKEVLSNSKTLDTVYSMRRELTTLWQRSTATRWCAS